MSYQDDPRPESVKISLDHLRYLVREGLLEDVSQDATVVSFLCGVEYLDPTDGKFKMTVLFSDPRPVVVAGLGLAISSTTSIQVMDTGPEEDPNPPF